MAKVAEKPPILTKGRVLDWLLWGIVGLVAVVAGVVVPFYISTSNLPFFRTESQQAKATQSVIPFIPKTDPPLVINIREGNGNRFLKVTLTLVMEGPEQPMTALLVKQRPFLRNWLNSYLADKSLKELQGTAAQNRIRRDIRDHFNDNLSDKVSDILFDEFLIQ